MSLDTGSLTNATDNLNGNGVNKMTAQAVANIEYVKTIGIVNNGDNGRGFANPYDIALHPDGRIYVLNRCDPARAKAIRIGVCNLEEDYLFEFGNGYGNGDGQFIWPVAIAVDSKDKLYVTDEYNQRVSVFDATGRFISHWGEKGRAPGQFDGPAGITVDNEDNLYIADQHNNRIQKFTRDGEYIAGWGEKGVSDGQFDLPWGIGLDSDGAVYVCDWRNDRIQKFTAEGEHLLGVGGSGDGEGELNRPSGVAVDSDGIIYVADWGNERVQAFNPDGGHAATLRGQATLSQWAMDYFSANPDEWETRQISDLEPELPEHLHSAYHVSSQIEPYFWGPVSVRLDAQDRLYVVETNRHRFQVYKKG